MHPSRDPESIVVFPHRGKLCLVALVALGFVAAGLWMALRTPSEEPWLSGWIRMGIGWSSVGFFGLGLVVLLVQLVRRRPWLVVDESGMDSPAALLRLGRIPWTDVSGFEIRSVFWQRFVVIQIRDPESFIARQPRLLRPLYRWNQRNVGTPAGGVPATLLSETLEQFRDRLLAFRAGVATR